MLYPIKTRLPYGEGTRLARRLGVSRTWVDKIIYGERTPSEGLKAKLLALGWEYRGQKKREGKR